MDCYIEYTDLDGNIFELDNITNLRITLNKEAKSDSAEIVVPDYLYIEEGNVIFQNGETARVFLKQDGFIDPNNLNIEEDLIFSATIIDVERDVQAHTIKLTCSNLTYNLLSTLFSQDITKKVNEIVDTIIQNSDSDGTTQAGVTTNIASTDSEGNPFPEVNFVSAWKTNYEAIEELSSPEYTGDDLPYLFWFDPDGTFNWVYPPDTVEALELSAYDGPWDMQHLKNETESVAMVIFNAGNDLNGNAIYGFEYNPTAENIRGSIRYQPMPQVAQELKRNFTGTNADFIELAEKRARTVSKRIINRLKSGVNKTTCKIKGQKISMAQLHVVKSFMFPTQNLRVDRVVHTFNRRGWVTQLELQEDPEAIDIGEVSST